MSKIWAFLNGVKGYRLDYTLAYRGADLIAYEWGREIAHRLTFRRFD